MTDVIGLPAAVAKERLLREGCLVTFQEARSRKGSGGEDERVIRASAFSDGVVVLTTALFVALKTGGDPA